MTHLPPLTPIDANDARARLERELVEIQKTLRARAPRGAHGEALIERRSAINRQLAALPQKQHIEVHATREDVRAELIRAGVLRPAGSQAPVRHGEPVLRMTTEDHETAAKHIERGKVDRRWWLRTHEAA